MVSSKGEPDNPELREKVKEEVKNLEKGGGKGSWSAWKAAELSKRYEAQGGGYKNQEGSKNKPKKGAPEKKEEGDDKKGAGKKEDGDGDGGKKGGAKGGKKK
jgi:hypothetical protein